MPNVSIGRGESGDLKRPPTIALVSSISPTATHASKGYDANLLLQVAV